MANHNQQNRIEIGSYIAGIMLVLGSLYLIFGRVAHSSMPVGNSSEASQEFYDFLYAHYFQSMPVDRTQIFWQNPIRIGVWFIVLSGFLYLVARYSTRVHRKRNEVYGATSFAGTILERNGKVAIASYIIWAAVTIWGIYFIVTHVLQGQIY